MAFVTAGIIAGGAALVGAGVNYIGSQNAANTEAGAANQSTNAQLAEYNQTRMDNLPWITSGQTNLATLNSEMPQLTKQFTLQDFQQSPGYQFQLNQGLQAVQRSAAARGMLNSTGTQENINNYAQGAANTDYQQALQNYTNSQQQRYNMLAGLSSNGQTAVAQVGAAGANAANNISSNIIGAGNASAAGQIGSANAISGGLSGAANGYMNANMMTNLFGGNNGGGGGGFNPSYGSTSLGQGMGPLGGGEYSPSPSYLGVGSLTG